jgi:ribonucleoside-diphosphate reductase alpha chain
MQRERRPRYRPRLSVVCSFALQYGVPLDVIRHALIRDGQGRPNGPLGVVLDLLAQGDE